MIANRKSIYYLRLFLDLALLNISFVIAAALAQPFEILLSRTYMLVLLMALNFLWYFTSNVVSFYEDFGARLYSFQFTNILKVVIVQAIASVFFIFIIKEDLFTRNFILYYTFLLIIVVSLRIEILKIIIYKRRGREQNNKNLIIVGSGEIGQTFSDMIKSNIGLGYNFLGFVDDENKSDQKLLGRINELDSILQNNPIDEVVIALPFYASNLLDDIFKNCNKHAVRVNIIPDYIRFLSKKFRINMLGNLPIISVRDEPLAEAHWRFIKRSFDVIVSVIISLLILSWLFPILAVIIKLTSSGSVFFIQERVGANDEMFNCYKFRTMKQENTEEKFQPVLEDDPRITKFGKFLRKSNFDELPQFINVLKGEMSIVGPRPHTIVFNNLYKEMVNELRLRSWVKPGITGWAQIHGYRGDVADEEENKRRTQKRIDFDLWYIENWSFWLDIQIVLLTIWQMIKRDTKGI